MTPLDRARAAAEASTRQRDADAIRMVCDTVDAIIAWRSAWNRISLSSLDPGELDRFSSVGVKLHETIRLVTEEEPTE